MAYRYTSPLRPLDIGWAEKSAKEASMAFGFEWRDLPPGQWTPATVYTFKHPLPPRFIDQWSLEVVS
jgi:hypothetical protein